MINSSGNVCKSSRSASQEAKIWCLLGPIWCDLLSYFPWAWHFFSCYLELRSPGCWFLCILVRSPEVQLSSCCCQLSVEGREKCIKPHSQHSAMPLTVAACSILSAHLRSPLTFLWHQEKCDTLIFFFIVWVSTPPNPWSSLGTSSHTGWERKTFYVEPSLCSGRHM